MREQPPGTWPELENQFEHLQEDPHALEAIVLDQLADFMARHSELSAQTEAWIIQVWDRLCGCPYQAEWHAVRVALVAERLATLSLPQESINLHPSDLFIAGLLHDASKLDQLPRWPNSQRRTDSHKHSGRRLLQKMGLPESLCRAVGRHELEDYPATLKELMQRKKAHNPVEPDDAYAACVAARILIIADSLTARSGAQQTNGTDQPLTPLFRTGTDVKGLLHQAMEEGWIEMSEVPLWESTLHEIVEEFNLPIVIS